MPSISLKINLGDMGAPAWKVFWGNRQKHITPWFSPNKNNNRFVFFLLGRCSPETPEILLAKDVFDLFLGAARSRFVFGEKKLLKPGVF